MEKHTVEVWEETIMIPTYGTSTPEKNPMFFEKRVYQGSSGVVYPNPVIEKIYDEKRDQAYQALFLENSFLKIMILPELGGRIQMAYDKIKERHFVYYNQVIKPALVGLTGPWISGGIEFNWPQHHRPSTFEPIDYRLEEHADGSKTVWVNEVEKMFRTKGMAGFTIHPDKAYLEIKVQLYNRTPLPQTFLWWANPAVKVNDHYQSIFPSDVNAVFDHGKRDVSSFPIATGTYYKVDYSPGTDISRYKNIPVPTSYMAIHSEYDFVGGYEHDSQAGLLHVANHHVSPGKKQWTWGHGDFGKAWDRNLTDEDGPYIELMTGVFTDNQPDFTWLMPYEEKSFTQYFMPYREIGMVKNASKDFLLGLEVSVSTIFVRVYATGFFDDMHCVLTVKGKVLFSENVRLSPHSVFSKRLDHEEQLEESDLELYLYNKQGKLGLSYTPALNTREEIPAPAKEALPPNDIELIETLFLTGQHLEQYRHATYDPVAYYQEALKRDPSDYRSNNAMGLWLLRRGKFVDSAFYFRKAIERATTYNPNPYDGEAFYNLGLSLTYQNKLDEAYPYFYKAVWNAAWQDAAYFSLAQLAAIQQNWKEALGHINASLDKNAKNGKAYVLKAAILRKLGQKKYSLKCIETGLERDGFNIGLLAEQYFLYQENGQFDQALNTRNNLVKLSRDDDHNYLEYAIDLTHAGFYDEAAFLLELAIKGESANPMLYYHAAFVTAKIDQAKALDFAYQAANRTDVICFPNKLEDIAALNHALSLNKNDSKAWYYLGNLWYDKRQYQDAIHAWEQSVQLDDRFPTAHRNLGIAYYNKLKLADKAYASYQRAFELDTSDARVLMEYDQLRKRLSFSAEERLNLLNHHRQVVASRDDLEIEYISLLNFIGKYREAYDLLISRKFHPWEGGEGKVSTQYIASLVALAKRDMQQGSYVQAFENLERTIAYPESLGEGKLPGIAENEIYYWLGHTQEKLGNRDRSTAFYQIGSEGQGIPGTTMYYNDQKPDQIFYQGLCLKALGKENEAKDLFKRLINYGFEHLNDAVKIDYFAVSLPDLLIFEDDLSLKNKAHCYYLSGLGYLGLNNPAEARNYFHKVLQLDVTHYGAKSHMEASVARLG